ncbi:metalloregulator ArsR/SmtB family transcription factor [Halodesulfovibrio sp.]|jgi:ArsR family transcriptional regulator|uniref:ArsR/SmtB family transcription factor n=1 Tax=Halodesulfovibrio sp. TaxID=1912772 RepID=UPI0025F48EB2|nr:metalloregulator ArsR/SmtB family transcription factor [Halodesulfovibrio sp.]MCT4626355.1 metalloregulator ArsR/SmtB family transcription factor [Halodesulfovibrio sp.]
MQKLTQTLKALSDQNRLRIIVTLMKYDELCACQFTQLLGIAGATVSRHLSVLHNAELVQFRKEGRWIFYKLGAGIAYAQPVLDWINDKAETCPELQADLAELKKILACAPEDISRKQRSGSAAKNRNHNED